MTVRGQDLFRWGRRAILLGAATLSGCTALPTDGPGYRDIQRGAAASLTSRHDIFIHTGRDNVDFNYALIDINPSILKVLDSIPADSFFGTYGSRGSVPVIRIGVGDVLQASVFESASGGLFGPGEPAAGAKGGNFVTFPPQTVTGSGTISVPYAGAVRVTGRTVPDVQKEIETKLSSRAIEPQVIVSVVEQNADAVTVIGDAGGNKIKITGSGERILDMISKAGGGLAGGKFAGYELYVTLQRKGRTATVPFTRLVSDPKENIYAAPGDIIYVYREPKTYVSIGAFANVGGGATTESGQTTGLSGQFRFEQEHLSLNEAIAKSGGLTDTRANPGQVFLYRPERRETLEKMGVDLSKFPPDQKVIPTVYRVNFRDPSSFFFVQKFQMRDKDIIYAANADSTEVTKFLNYVNTFTNTASSAFVDGRTIGDISAGAHVFTNGTAVVVP